MTSSTRLLLPTALLLAAALTGCGTSAPATEAGGPAFDSVGTLGLPAAEQVYELDLRQTPLTSLSDGERARLGTEPQVRVTLSDGSTLSYRNAEGVMLFEGDIALNRSEKAYQHLVALTDGQLGEQGLSRFAPKGANWAGNVIPYYWKSGTYSADQERVMKNSIARWNEQAGNAVKWVWDSTPRNAVQFIKGGSGSCGWSYVGSIGGHQQLAISCFSTHTVIHEMGHAAGLWHEHQRCDRDQYVSIPSSYLNDSVNFGKNCNIYSYGPYDYDSIMNYGNPFVYALSNPGNNYVGKASNLGKLPDLSAGDISALNMTYLGQSGGTTPLHPRLRRPRPTPAPSALGRLLSFRLAATFP
ncbi:M12 family metallopeptidase [Deinococcus lacus]|uniref:M12 family metallopeptidase n=1 Tax=Deinococcus lacus TaxID=392561 RepID=A0ABW1YIB7_9DEIO